VLRCSLLRQRESPAAVLESPAGKSSNPQRRNELHRREFYAASCAPDEFASSIKSAGEPLLDRRLHSPLLKLSRDMVLHDGRLPADLKGAHRVFNVAVLDSDALVLTQMLSPRVHHECLDPATWICQVLKQAPIDGAVSPPAGA